MALRLPWPLRRPDQRTVRRHTDEDPRLAAAAASKARLDALMAHIAAGGDADSDLLDCELLDVDGDPDALYVTMGPARVHLATWRDADGGLHRYDLGAGDEELGRIGPLRCEQVDALLRFAEWKGQLVSLNTTKVDGRFTATFAGPDGTCLAFQAQKFQAQQ